MKPDLQKIRKEMKRQGMTQRALARLLRVTPQAVFGILSGHHEARLATIEKYAWALGIDGKDLISR